MDILKPYKIVIFGHRDFSAHRKVEDLLFPLLKKLMDEKELVDVLIGRNGEFDIYAASIVKRVQKLVDN